MECVRSRKPSNAPALQFLVLVIDECCRLFQNYAAIWEGSCCDVEGAS
jgi:hypothetical protein